MWLNFCQFLLFYLWQFDGLTAETERFFKISESIPPGNRIGWVFGDEPYISDNPTQQNFLIVFPEPGSQAERV